MHPYLLRGLAQKMQCAGTVRLDPQVLVADVESVPQEVRGGWRTRVVSLVVQFPRSGRVARYADALCIMRSFVFRVGDGRAGNCECLLA